MATPRPLSRPLARLKPLIRQTPACKQQRRFIGTGSEDIWSHKPLPGYSSLFKKKTPLKRIRVIPSPPSTRRACHDPIATITTKQLTTLDPTGSRTRLFLKTNPEAARVGDILLVRQSSGEPFAGVCMNIRRRGIDTAILLRANLTRVGVEMWFKIYSPNVEGIEVVQRKEKRARRARLYYMRKPKHDRGSVENVVRGYLRQKASLTGGKGEKALVGGKKGGKGKGKKR